MTEDIDDRIDEGIQNVIWCMVSDADSSFPPELRAVRQCLYVHEGAEGYEEGEVCDYARGDHAGRWTSLDLSIEQMELRVLPDDLSAKDVAEHYAENHVFDERDYNDDVTYRFRPEHYPGDTGDWQDWAIEWLMEAYRK